MRDTLFAEKFNPFCLILAAMLAEIITIGDEILIGQIVDTNSAWMGQKLNEIGIQVKQISSVSDDREHILKALADAHNRADLILITGGLGPTKDDITKHTLCAYFGTELVLNQEALTNVEAIFARFNRPMLDVNYQQAMVPVNCQAIQNENGTAPGMWFEQEGRIYVSMPGVPHEMMGMMEKTVLPRLQAMGDLPVIVHKTILTAGIGESFLAKQIEAIEDGLPKHIKLAYLPKLGQVRLRLSGKGKEEASLRAEIEEYAEKIKALIPEFVITEVDIPLEEVILQKLIARKQTLSTAESCTGGYIAHLLTAIPGASRAFEGGIVSYSYAMKEKELGVQSSTLAEHGAVSKETVTEMLQGALKHYNTDYAIACSGIAGPDGGTDDKPVGTVWIGVASASEVYVKKYSFGNKRQQNIERTAAFALMMLYKIMEKR